MTVFEEYPSLFHYTTSAGLDGILTSQTLWCTHYKYLNDSQEGVYAKDILREVVYLKCLEEYKDQKKSCEKTNDILQIFYTWLEKDSKNGPYVLSFCGTKNEQNRKEQRRPRRGHPS